MPQIPKSNITRLKGEAYKKLQVEVLERDGFTCQECGRWTENPPHHIKFRSQGGDDTVENLITLCNGCHYKKHN